MAPRRPVGSDGRGSGAITGGEAQCDRGGLSGQAIAGLPADGLLWFAYRKGGAAKASGFNRDNGWAALTEAGYRAVRSISLDEVWTGLRFRELAKVKART